LSGTTLGFVHPDRWRRIAAVVAFIAFVGCGKTPTAPGESSGSVQALAQRSPAALGGQPVMLVAIRFQGDPPYSAPDQAKSLLAASDSLLRRLSKGQAWFAGTAYAPLDVNVTANANFDEIVAAGDAALVAAGVAINQTPCVKRLFIFDPALYGGGGQAESGACRAVIRGWDGVAVHEFLHTLGLRHSASLSMPGGGSEERGDRLDVMGGGGEINPAYARWLGWWNPPVSPCSGSYVLTPWATDNPTYGAAFKFTVDANIAFWSNYFTDVYADFENWSIALRGVSLTGNLSWLLDTDLTTPTFRAGLKNPGDYVDIAPCRFTHGGNGPGTSLILNVSASGQAPPPR